MYSQLDGLKDKFKSLSSLFDRLTYEFEEVSKGSAAACHSLNRLLYMSKAERVYAEYTERVGEYLRRIGGGEGSAMERKERREEFVQFMNFCIKYIRSIEVNEKRE